MRSDRDRIHRNLLLLSAAMMRCIDSPSAGCRDVGLTSAQMHVLRFMYGKADLVMGDVASGLGFSFAAGTKTIDRLAKKGLAARRHGELDGRQTVVSLTQQGEQLARALLDGSRTAIMNVLDRMDDDLVEALGRSIDGFLRSYLAEGASAEDLCIACGYRNGLDCAEREGDCVVQQVIATPAAGEIL